MINTSLGCRCTSPHGSLDEKFLLGVKKDFIVGLRFEWPENTITWLIEFDHLRGFFYWSKISAEKWLQTLKYIFDLSGHKSTFFDTFLRLPFFCLHPRRVELPTLPMVQAIQSWYDLVLSILFANVSKCLCFHMFRLNFL